MTAHEDFLETLKVGYAQVIGPDKISIDNSGLRYDEEKIRIDLIPPECIKELGLHFTKGANKYAERNWQSGMDWTKCYNSLMRHALTWMEGEDIDPENGSHHAIAIAWNAMALYWYWLKGIGRDTRPKYTKPMPNCGLTMHKSTLKDAVDSKLTLNQYKEHKEEIECCGKKY